MEDQAYVEKGSSGGKPIRFIPSLYGEVMEYFREGPAFQSKEDESDDEHYADLDEDEGVEQLVTEVIGGGAVWLSLSGDKMPTKIVAKDAGDHWLIHVWKG